MNALRNLFLTSTRTISLLRQNGQNALFNLTQQPVDGITVPTTANFGTPNGTVNLPYLSTKPTIIPTSILENINFKGKNLTSNVVAPGSLSPTTVKRLRRMQKKVELAYLCKICNTRNVKEVSEAAFKNGIVILQCDGCAVNHLICDNLGWFADTKGKDLSFDQVLAERASGRIKVFKMNQFDELIN